MMILQTNSYASQPLQALDVELLEFLSLYDAEDEELIDQVIDEESDQRKESNKVTKAVKEAER